jgi:hypothetical protein
VSPIGLFGAVAEDFFRRAEGGIAIGCMRRVGEGRGQFRRFGDWWVLKLDDGWMGGSVLVNKGKLDPDNFPLSVTRL